MIKTLTIRDNEALFDRWKSTSNMGLRRVDDSKEGIARFLRRNPNTSFAAYENGRLVGAVLSGHDGRRGYLYHTVVLPDCRGRGIASHKAITGEDNRPFFSRRKASIGFFNRRPVSGR